jgi:hypothetical protein
MKTYLPVIEDTSLSTDPDSVPVFRLIHVSIEELLGFVDSAELLVDRAATLSA